MHESEKSQHSKDFLYQPRGVKGGEEGWTIIILSGSDGVPGGGHPLGGQTEGRELPPPGSGLPREWPPPGSGLPRGVDSMVRLCLLSLVSTGGPF